MDIALKQRLVGASVLIALAVVVLPMLLGGRPEQAAQQSQRIELPPQPAELDFQTRRYPIGESPASGVPGPANSRAVTPTASSAASSAASSTASPTSSPTSTGDSPGAVAHVEVQPRDFEDALQGDSSAAAADSGAESGAPAPAETGPEVHDVTEDAPQGIARDVAQAATGAVPPAAAAVPEPASTAPAASGSGRYVVQVASFGSVANANLLAETLRGQGYGVLSDAVQSDVGTLHRVRIGPYASEAEATEAASRVRAQVTGVNPRVVDLLPEAAAQVTTPSDPLVRWVVQVGSFSAAGNADALVERLRAEGLSAYQETVSSAGSTIYRVRVGPYIERDEAIRADALITARLSLDGVVMSAD
jgi:DedD protein